MKCRTVLTLTLTMAMFFAPAAMAAKYEWRLAEEEITDSVCAVSYTHLTLPTNREV